jgi:hypothetical protein
MTLRAFVGVLIACVLLGFATCVAAQVETLVPEAGKGLDPLTTARAAFVSADDTKNLPVDVVSRESFTGWMMVKVECCIDALTGQQAHPKDLDLSLGDPVNHMIWQSSHVVHQPASSLRCHGGTCQNPNRLSGVVRVHLNAGELTGFPLHIRSFDNPTPGRYLITVSAVSFQPDASVAAPNTWFNFAVLGPVASDSPAPADCAPAPGPVTVTGYVDIDLTHVNGPPGLEALPLRAVILGLFAEKRANPDQTSFTIGVATAGGPAPGAQWAGWVFTIGAPPTPLPPTQTMIVLQNNTLVDAPNNTFWDKEMAAFDGAACPHMLTPHGTFRVMAGSSVTATFDAATQKTLLLRRQACGGWFSGCNNMEFWEDIAVLSQSNFYDLAGGRSVTINWFFSQAE